MPEEAQKALQQMNGHMVGKKPLYVAFAQRKEQRRAQLEAQYAQRQHMKPYQTMLHGVPAPGMFPGAPMMYPPGAMPPQRGYFMPPQGMMGPRPRWQQPGQQGPTGPYGQRMPGGAPHYGAGQMALPPGVRPSRPPKGGQPSRGGPPGARYGAPQQPRPQGNKKYSERRGTNTTPGGALGGPNQTSKEGSMVATTNGPSTADPGLPITREELAKLSTTEQKQALGEAIYPRIEPLAKEFTGKVTGMLLEMDNMSLLSLLGDMKSLETKVKEAVEALNVHMQKGDNE
eukprot:TRINITY_DN51498_c0_g1_i1.p1 TRINITY_DN51498_c0_g1~~TRINITY_DN51498_c0_g1_i1.p1  ORF type:complete len:286 (-),score=41.42 TRINITY_DN51498_c0_g1_i1:134-991(-)